jgi:uncharacterized phiE125 gp8 family phage protein
MTRYRLETAPSVEPITGQEVTNYLHETAYASMTSDQSGLIDIAIESARKDVEKYTWGQVISATYDMYLDDWSRAIKIFKSPVSAISSIKYQDENGAEQTLSSSLYDTVLTSRMGDPGRIYIHGSLPTLDPDNKLERVVIRFVAGYTNAAAVPGDIKISMLKRIGTSWEIRQETHTGTQVNTDIDWFYMMLNDYKCDF